MALIDLKLCFDDEANKFVAVNVETGEVLDFTAPAKKATPRVAKKAKEEESTDPQIILNEKNYAPNSAALATLDAEPGDRLEIKYKKVDNTMRPIIGKQEIWGTAGGNLVAKKGTVQCTGKGHDELAKYGTIFTLVEYGEKPGLFVLVGDKKEATEYDVQDDENVEIVDQDLVADINALGGTSIEDEEATALDSDEFDKMLKSL